MLQLHCAANHLTDHPLPLSPTLSIDTSIYAEVARAGAVPQVLLRLQQARSVHTKFLFLQLLDCLALEPSCRAALVEAGGLVSIIRFLSRDSDKRVRDAATGALGRMAGE